MSVKTGFAKIPITPPLGTPVCGYYKERFTKGVIDDIFVRAIAFDDGKNKAVILCAELCLLTKEHCDDFRKTISDFTKVPVEGIFITCTHTHTGPSVPKDPNNADAEEKYYYEVIKRALRDAAQYALNDAKESRFYIAEGEAKNISFVRRYRMKDGSVRTNPGVGNKDIDHALGEPNETLKLVKVVRENADDIYIVNYGTHPDTIGGEYISPDYPGYVCDTLENAIPSSKCIFLLAPQGDVNHVNPAPSKGERAITEMDFDDVPRGLEHAKHMARVIAGGVLSVCTIAEEMEMDSISFACENVSIPSHQENDRLEEAKKINELYLAGRQWELPYKGMELTTVVAEAYRIVTLADGPESFEFNLSAIKVGDFVFAGIPGEPFTEIANRIYAGSPYATTILCCLTNGGGTYFPTSRAYEEGGYEARGSQLAPGGDDVIVNGMCDLLKKIK